MNRHFRIIMVKYKYKKEEKGSKGLLIFTNDGDLTNKLTHPKNEVPKTYLVKTETFIPDEGLKALRNGVEIDGVMTKKCYVKLVDRSVNKGTKIHITITEGRNRQIRKMISAVGAEVDFLKRIKLGELTCSGLDRGDVRKLTPREVEYLKSL